MFTSTNNPIPAFREALSQAKHIVVLAGAGLSAASGIPTFRGAGGFWRKYNAMDLATPEAFDEILVWCGNFIIIGGNYESFFSSFRHNHTLRKEALMLHSAAKAQPNAAHKTIALLSSNKEVLKKVAPNAEPFKLITQNVDNLSIRPLGPSPEASALPIEMHGNLYRIKCTSESPDHVETNTDSPIVPALGGTELIFDRGEMDKSLKPEDLPRCSKCGELARPAVVWFGESIDLLPEIDVYINRCDLLLVVGTSSTVSPASFFSEAVKSTGGKVAVFNIEKTLGKNKCDSMFLGPCEATLGEALGLTVGDEELEFWLVMGNFA